MSRITVALTFDFDAESYWVGTLKSTSPSAISRGTYGAAEGVPRLLNLLDSLSLPATFFVPGYTAERHPDSLADIRAAGHEIAHHGYLHEPPNLLDPAGERLALEKGLDALERVAKTTPLGYRSPSGEISPATIGLLEEMGFEYDSSQFGADRPYFASSGPGPGRVVEIPISAELTDSCHFMFLVSPVAFPGLSAPSKVEEIWRGDFEGLYREGGDACYLLTMHPQIMGRPHRVLMLERLLKHILIHDGVRFLPMIDVARRFRARQAMLAKAAAENQN